MVLKVATLIHLTNLITSFDRKEYCAGIFMDLSKAFDTVNHLATEIVRPIIRISYAKLISCITPKSSKHFMLFVT